MKEQETGKTILVVDDEDLMRGVICTALRREGYSVSDAPGGQDALKMASEKEYDLAILDVRMPGIDGFQVKDVLRKMSPHTKIIFFTAIPDAESRSGDTTRCENVFAYLKKPCKLEALKSTVKEALTQKATRIS